MQKRIGLVGLTSNKNIGDYMLAESTKFLLNKHSPDMLFLDIDVDPRSESTYRGLRKINLKVFDVLNRYDKFAFKIYRSKYVHYLYQYTYWWVKLNWYYKKKMKNLDGLVFVGGGFIKFKNQGLNYLDEQILKIAKKNDIPVMYNAVGIEGYDSNDIRCQRLKKALNNSTVSVITTRDDLESLSNNYITNTDIKTDLVGDPVFWLGDMYPQESRTKSNIIGINLVNPNNFKRYGGNVDRYTISNFYKNLIQELNMNDIDYYLYTNGMEVDQKFGVSLVESMNLPKNKLIDAPSSSKELVEITRRFDAILSARMHSGIVAYALDIPIVGLIWSSKIEFLANIIDMRDLYFNENELDYKKIVNLLIENSRKKQNTMRREKLKLKTTKYLNMFLESIKDTEKSND